nr:iron chelate uptake ABC transporter family permease subunit [Catenuloplanes japonicus]
MTARRSVGLALAVVLLAAVVAASVGYGSTPLPVGTVWEAVARFDPAVDAHLVVRTLRIPRTALGLLAGLALGTAGAVMQTVTRNPLADPGLLGINAGAALCVVLGSHVLGVTTLPGYVWFAFAGAAGAAIMVYGVGTAGRGNGAPVTLALAGAALTALLTSLTTSVLLIDRVSLDQFRFWAVGSLAGRDATIALQVTPFIVAGLLLALLSARGLNALALGDDTARALGQRVALARAAAITAVVLLAGAATAAAGPIAFVGLAVPHVARLLAGADNRWLLPYSAVLAAILLLGADIVGRIVARPAELQVGIVTALIGAPVFVALVRAGRA